MVFYGLSGIRKTTSRLRRTPPQEENLDRDGPDEIPPFGGMTNKKRKHTMKRFLTCALCFVSLPAVAVTLYYEQGGACPGLYKTRPLSGCNATQVTHLDVTPMSDTVFDGFKVNGQTVVYADGTVASNAADILRGASLTSDKIQQSYTCQSGFSENNNGVCVDYNGNMTYVDFENGVEESGFEVEPANLGRGGAGSNECVHSKFKVKIHWCPPKYGAYTGNWSNGLSGWNPPSVPENFGYPELWPSDSDCNTADEVLYYDWKDRGTSSASYHKNSYTGPLVTSINKPDGKFNGWTLRGFYLLEDDLYDVPSGCNASTNATYSPICYSYWGNRNYFAKRRVVTATNTEGTARLGLPKPNSNTITNYVDLDDSHNGANGAWSNTRWTVYDCSITHKQAENKTYHLYAGWARDCETPNDGTCNLAIRRTGLSQSNNKGDAFYTTTCNNGATPTGNGTYNPICPEKCALNNLSACTQSECLNLNGTNWCAGTPQCVLGSSARLCCMNSLANCTSSKDCESVGGTWNGTTCQ